MKYMYIFYIKKKKNSKEREKEPIKKNMKVAEI